MDPSSNSDPTGRASLASLITFATAVVLMVGATDYVSRRVYPELFLPESNEGKPIAADTLDPRRFDSTITDPLLMKQRGLFWAVDIGTGLGVALKALENADVFATLFPGYASARFDQTLWNTYFQRQDFNPSYFFEGLPVLGEHAYGVKMSWTGCFDLYRRYGADVVVFGNSEVYRGVLSDRLARRLRDLHVMKQPKVLACTSSGLTVNAIPLMVNELKRVSTAKPLAIVWGYSLWTAFADGVDVARYDQYMAGDIETYRRQGPNPQDALPHIQAFQSAPQPAHERTNWLRPSLKAYFSELTWDAFMTSALAKIMRLRDQQRAARARPHGPPYGFSAFLTFSGVSRTASLSFSHQPRSER
jgi:hypothetical protein